MGQNLLFDDSSFTNARRYFWALQSLRVFDDHISGTVRLLKEMIRSIDEDSHSRSGESENQIQEDLFNEHRAILDELRARIERKRQEIESLNNGLFSASSVAEARFSSEQNGNIRLLTLVTIAYLPLSFVATIYGMNVLPEGTSLGSFFVATAVLSVITFAIVFNLQLLTVFIRRHLFGKALDSMRLDPSPQWRDRAQHLRQEGANKRKSFPASKWLYLGYLFHLVFDRKAAPPSAEKGRRDDSHTV
ncbi:cora-like Mg2+ transporter protein-domain-containing protein [Chaetomium strumarium]|uniref:Cora-like Mg2+ transporter protein-domain-containing protein n=1 Tax=Chaetomium strumarium TaxID=1170767 RepID=A0AAJ0M6J7_9PEZI|nr:cora-like Mg2+ transporter protein-domain-containing protein [Chaetomium strumarium]